MKKIPTEALGRVYLEEIIIAQYAAQHGIDYEKLIRFLFDATKLDEELSRQLDAASGMSKGYWLALQADLMD